MIQLHRGLLAAGLPVAVAIACGHAQGQARCDGGGSDSARAARVALDTLARIQPFPSQVYRFSRDSSGFRIVTLPAPDHLMTDGMAIIRLNAQCQVTSLVQTDSA